MKKCLFVTLAALALVACNRKPKAPEMVQISDYLYEIRMDDYDENLAEEKIKLFKPMQAACSEVRRGQFIGRNLDWYINRDASAVLHLAANPEKHRYASIGMVGCQTHFSIDAIAAGLSDSLFQILPVVTTDGINEKGLYVGVNVVPTGETSLDSTKWAPHKWGVGAAFTQGSDSDALCTTCLTRYVLNSATSVDEALNFINSHNWYDPLNFPQPGETQSFHWLIADANETAVVEFIDNKMCAVRSSNIEEPSYATIMTNFNNVLMNEKQLIQWTAAGLERYDLLKEHYHDATSVEAMKTLLQRVWYSKIMQKENEFPSEYAGSLDKFTSADLYAGKAKGDADFIREAEKVHAQYQDSAYWHVPTTTLWYTTHTSVYDLKNKTFEVLVHEGIDGQKEWYSVKF